MKDNMLSTILIVVIVAGLIILLNIFGKNSGGCQMGNQQQVSSPAENVQLTESKNLLKPLVVENSKMKARIMSWNSYYGFRIDQVELKNFKMNKTASTTEQVPVRLLEATRFFDSTGRYLGTWDDDIEASIPEGARFKAAVHAGFEVSPSDSATLARDFGRLETIVTNDSTVALVWTDSLGAVQRVELTLDGYEFKINASDTLAGFKFFCEDGIKLTEPMDKSEVTLHQIYYRPAGKNPEWFNIGGARKIVEGKKEIVQGPYEWIAIRGKYFSTIVIPDRPVNAGIAPVARPDQRIGLEFGVSDAGSFRLYFGPLDYKALSKMGHRLGRIVELGGITYRWLSIGMLEIFEFLYRIIRNYGAAIIIFALLIKLVFLPLSRSQQRSMQKMQMLQPKLKELQERFKDDPKRLNEETMRMYRDHKASPLGGCLPLLIQMPVFFGLYAVLRTAVSLRGAAFVNLFTIHINKPFDFLFIHIPTGNLTWLTDLSQRDPFFILPVLMSVASIFQSLLSNVDPRQRTTAIIFPIVIAFVFLNFPSGLQLYWLVFNLLSLLEYWIFRRGAQGGVQWQSKKPETTPSATSLQKSSRR